MLRSSSSFFHASTLQKAHSVKPTLAKAGSPRAFADIFPYLVRSVHDCRVPDLRVGDAESGWGLGLKRCT